MRVAVLGASHWHVPLYYIPALKAAGADIVAVHDPDPCAVDRVAGSLSCPRYTCFHELLDRESVDLVFAHAPHAQMTQMAAELVARHVPFHMEKPMGVDWRELDALAVKAQTEGVWTSVALVSRYYGVVETLRQLKETGQLGAPCHYTYRLFGGGPQRYREWGVPWMLDPQQAGAGPLWNFGPHVVDLFLYLVDEEVTHAQCWVTHAIHRLPIEDLATLRLHGRGGAQGFGEVSYTMPDGYERFFSLTTDRLHWGGTDMACGEILLRDGSRVPFSGAGSDTVYHLYVRDTLRRFEAGQPARATIVDMARALRILCAARLSAHTGKVMRLTPPPALEDEQVEQF